MTPAEELLAAVKEHATAIRFEFDPASPVVRICELSNPQVNVGRNADGNWYEDVYGNASDQGFHIHSSASSAVYSAFLRARK